MSTNKITLLILALTLPTTALAASSKLSCVSVEELDARSEDCSHNPRYTKAGNECLAKLEKIIAKGTRISTDRLRKDAEAALAKEKPKKTKSSFNLSSQDGDAILEAAKAAKETISAYRDNIFYPEDWDAPKELIGDPIDFLDSQKCYAEARDSLEKIEAIVDQYIRELERK